MIPEFIDLVNKPNLDKAKLIWRTMQSISHVQGYLQASFRRNVAGGLRHAQSSLVYHLKSTAWVPQRIGGIIEFVQPCEASIEKVPAGFPIESGQMWLDAIEFASVARKRSEEYCARNAEAERLGFSSADEMKMGVDLVRKLKESGMTLEDATLRLFPIQQKKLPQFPSRSVSDPERRKKKIEQQIAEAPEKSFVKKERSVRTSRDSSKSDVDAFLRGIYTNDDHQLICQICRDEMPFKKRNGQYYFEKVEAFDLPIEHEANYLALCPLCAAKYTEFIKGVSETRKKAAQMLYESQELELPIALGNEHSSIRFDEPHYINLKVILESTRRLH